ncbi:hypothetical protein D3C85_958200 [compost metagenome]
MAVGLRLVGGEDGVLGQIDAAKLPARQAFCQGAAVVPLTTAEMDQLALAERRQQGCHGLHQGQLVSLLQEAALGTQQGPAVAVLGILLARNEIQITFRGRIEMVLVVAIDPAGGFMKMQGAAAQGTLKMHTHSLG